MKTVSASPCGWQRRTALRLTNWPGDWLRRAIFTFHFTRRAQLHLCLDVRRIDSSTRSLDAIFVANLSAPHSSANTSFGRITCDRHALNYVRYAFVRTSGYWPRGRYPWLPVALAIESSYWTVVLAGARFVGEDHLSIFANVGAGSLSLTRLLSQLTRAKSPSAPRSCFCWVPLTFVCVPLTGSRRDSMTSRSIPSSVFYGHLELSRTNKFGTILEALTGCYQQPKRPRSYAARLTDL